MSTTSVDRLTGLSSSVAIKAPCRAATTADITLSGTQTIDGIAVVADDRVLVKDQTDQTENGIYVVSATAWTRDKDFDGVRDVVKGTQVLVTSGTAAAGVLYQLTTSNPITIGTSNLVFTALAISGANTKLTNLGAMDGTAGLVTQTGTNTFTKRTLTGTANQVTVTDGDGASGNPTISLDATLVALAALDSTAGILTQTAADTFVRRSLTAPAAGLSITNPAGTAGSPTFVLANDLSAVEGLSGTGMAARTATDTWTTRTITGTTQQITVTNGDGVSGNPTLTLPTSVKMGTSHTLNAGATNSALIAGESNSIDGGGYDSAIIGGGNNSIATVSTSVGTVIVGGESNTISGASADSTTIVGGIGGTISGTGNYSSIVGGDNNTISSNSNTQTVVGGRLNSISSTAARDTIVGGSSNSISASGGLNLALGGSTNTITGTAFNSTVMGTNNNATTGADSAFAFGTYAKASKANQFAQSSGRFSVVGDAQTSVIVMRRQTTTVTGAEMFIDGSSSRLTIPTDTTWLFKIYLVARRTDADNESAMYEFFGGIDNNAGTTALVGSVQLGTPIEDTVAWAAVVTADDANDALIITVTGENAKTINWVARVTLVEVTG